MKYEILRYLINHKEGTSEQFTQFLRTTFATSTRKLLRDTLLEMLADEIVVGPKDMLIAVFMPREDLGRTMADFTGNIAGWRINTAGEKLYFDNEHRNHERQVNSAVMNASISTTETNASIKSLNEVIIPRYNKFQKTATIVTLIVAALSFIAIGLSAYFASAGVTSADVRALRQQMEKNTAILDSLRRYEKGIDSSLQEIASDSTHGNSR